MDTKNRMRPLITAIALAVSASAAAQCYVRSATVVSGASQLQRIADIKEIKLPYNGLRKCIATMRVQINNEWQDAEGEGIAETDQQACSNARDIAQARFLIPVDDPVVNSESSMVCTDAPPIRIRERIRVGDWIQESEVGVFHRYPRPFRHQGTECKWFSHKEAHLGKPVGFAGIMCTMQPGKWQVVDLF